MKLNSIRYSPKYPLSNVEVHRLCFSREEELNKSLLKDHWDEKDYDSILSLASGLPDKMNEFKEKVIDETLKKICKSPLVQDDSRITPTVLIAAYRRMNWADGHSLDYYPLLFNARKEIREKHLNRLKRIKHHKFKRKEKARQRKSTECWTRK